VEIGPAHLKSTGRRVLAGRGPPAKWLVPSAGMLGHPYPPGTVSPCHPQTLIAPPFSRPRRRPHVHLPSLSTTNHGLSSKPSPFSPRRSSLGTTSAPYRLCLSTRAAAAPMSPALPHLKHRRRRPRAPTQHLSPEHVTKPASIVKNGHNNSSAIVFFLRDASADAGLLRSLSGQDATSSSSTPPRRTARPFQLRPLTDGQLYPRSVTAGCQLK
jgi:hypothetical protein